MLADKRRLVLFSDSPEAEEVFRSSPEVQTGKRLFFRYEGGEPDHDPELLPLNGEMLRAVSGRVIPQSFWEKDSDFLQRGKGFCLLREGRPAGWAFSAAVSSTELDIGVETAPSYQRQGLAKRAAGELIRFALETGRRPVWACAATNTGSRRTAEKLGFVRCGSCLTFQKRQI